MTINLTHYSILLTSLKMPTRLITSPIETTIPFHYVESALTSSFLVKHPQSEVEAKCILLLQHWLSHTSSDLVMQYLYLKYSGDYLYFDRLENIVNLNRIQTGWTLQGFLHPNLPNGLVDWFRRRNITLGCGCLEKYYDFTYPPVGEKSQNDVARKLMTKYEITLHTCSNFVSGKSLNVCLQCRHSFNYLSWKSQFKSHPFTMKPEYFFKCPDCYFHKNQNQQVVTMHSNTYTNTQQRDNSRESKIVCSNE